MRSTDKTMIRYVFTILVCIIVAIYGQEHTSTAHPVTREIVDIGGQQYLFTNDYGGDWETAEWFCANQSMILVGFETMEEWDSVTAYMISSGTSVWEWDHSDVFFDKQDSRWASSEPGGGPYETERVVVSVDISASLFSVPMLELHQVVCESIPA
ncbi:hypothetical protein B566_EDAN004979 [Ephemera danica]|nr:hypothetical protein B566_EDAN004979 [Ephemera danica]